MEIDISEEVNCRDNYNISDHDMTINTNSKNLRKGCGRITRDRYLNSFHKIFGTRLNSTKHIPSEIKFLTYHHQAGGRGGDGRAWNVYTGIHAAHTSGKCKNGKCDQLWGDIAYHYMVDRFGNIIEARALDYAPNSGSQGKGSAGQAGNFHYPNHFAVMFAGNFNIQSPQPAAIKSAARILSAAQLRFGLGSDAIQPHRHYSPLFPRRAGWGTSCPGDNFTEKHHEELVMLTTLISIQTILTERKCKPGSVDGDLGPNTEAAIERLESVVGDLPSEPAQLLNAMMSEAGTCNEKIQNFN